MKAYAILDGGGVKGAALVGALHAAEQHRIDFVGYGGTSAGAIVATLAAVGYTPSELRSIVFDELRFSSFVGSAQQDLHQLTRLAGSLGLIELWRSRGVIRKVRQHLGLSTGDGIGTFVRQKIVQKIPALRDTADITFEDLKTHGCKPLKVVASDLSTRLPQVYSAAGGREQNGSVLDAVRASASYPFVFRPVRAGQRYLVDGGLCSNLPVFLFEDERSQDALPVIAIDLVPTPVESAGEYGLKDFCRDMLDAALESGDHLVRKVMSGVHHVRVGVPPDIGTLSFDLTRADVQRLFDSGRADAHDYFTSALRFWPKADSAVKNIQALAGVSVPMMSTVLRAMAQEFTKLTPARDLRASVSRPTARGTLIIAYQYAMDRDADVDLELDLGSGCSGRALAKRVPIAADLDEARGTFESEWGMTREQQTKVRSDRRAMLSFPLFDVGSDHPENAPLLGVVSVDTSSTLGETGWVGERSHVALDIGKRWAAVMSRLLT